MKRKKKNVKKRSRIVDAKGEAIGKGTTATAVGTAVVSGIGKAGVVPASKEEKQRRLFTTLHLKRWEAVREFKRQA